MIQPEAFYRECGATHLGYTDIEQVWDALCGGEIDEYTAAQSICYGLKICDWDEAVAAVDQTLKDWGCYD